MLGKFLQIYLKIEKLLKFKDNFAKNIRKFLLSSQ